MLCTCTRVTDDTDTARPSTLARRGNSPTARARRSTGARTPTRSSPAFSPRTKGSGTRTLLLALYLGAIVTFCSTHKACDYCVACVCVLVSPPPPTVSSVHDWTNVPRTLLCTRVRVSERLCTCKDRLRIRYLVRGWDGWPSCVRARQVPLHLLAAGAVAA
jgi:hypothetical protein